MTHPLPVCEALQILGLSGAEVARQLRLHRNTWNRWKAGQDPQPKIKAALLLLAKRLVREGRDYLSLGKFSREFSGIAEDKIQQATELIIQQEAKWSNLSIAGMLAADRMLSSPVPS